MTVPRWLKWTLGVVAGHEVIHALARFHERKEQFERAKKRAANLGRKLLVIGDPDAGVHTRLVRAYDCGDACADLNGCPACPVQYAVDITKGKLPFDNDSVVVFESCVLEYVDDIAAGFAEMIRIAGSRDNYFGVRVSPHSLTAYLYYGAKWVLFDAPKPHTFEAVQKTAMLSRGAPGTLLGIERMKP